MALSSPIIAEDSRRTPQNLLATTAAAPVDGGEKGLP